MTLDNQFAKGIHRQVAMLLDNVGIRVRLADCPSHPAYQFWKYRRYGYNWLSAMWCQHIRRWLFPKRHQAVVEKYEAAKAQIQQEILNAVMKLGEDMIR